VPDHSASASSTARTRTWCRLSERMGVVHALVAAFTGRWRSRGRLPPGRLECGGRELRRGVSAPRATSAHCGYSQQGGRSTTRSTRTVLVMRWPVARRFRLLPWLTIAGDYATLIDRAELNIRSGGAGLQAHGSHHAAFPVAPRRQRGTGFTRRCLTRVAYALGFEYTVPITLGRYAGARARDTSRHSAYRPPRTRHRPCCRRGSRIRWWSRSAISNTSRQDHRQRRRRHRVAERRRGRAHRTG
jgi:hypothetical protein